MQTLRLRVRFPIQIKPVFQRLLFLSSHTNIRVHFGIRENLSLRSPSRCAFLFLKNLLCFDLWIFQRKLAIIFSSSKMFFFFSFSFSFSFFFFLLEKVCNLGKVVTWAYTSKGTKDAWTKRNHIQDPFFFLSLVFLHHNAIVRQHVGSDKVSSQCDNKQKLKAIN